MKKMPVHILADVYWLPSHNPDSFRIPTDSSFRTVSFFTTDFSSGWTAEITSSKTPLPNQTGFYPVRLFFYALDEKRNEIKRLSNKAELLIMAGYEVIAVCRNLRIPETEIYMDAPWTES